MKSEIDPNIGPEGWDKEAIYDAEIAPLMTQIIAICKRENIPMFASFAYRDSDGTGDGNTSYCTTHLAGPNDEIHEPFREVNNHIRRQTMGFAAYTITIQ